MSRWLKRMKNAARHTIVLFSSLGRAADRARLAQLITIMRQAPAWFEAGGLPGLIRGLEAHGQFGADPAILERALDQADALAVFWPASPFRVCLRRAALRYTLLRANGQAVVFIIGVRRGRRKLSLDGHAWVEFRGQAFREDAAMMAAMVEMYRHPV
jgi:hypothetical protein